MLTSDYTVLALEAVEHRLQVLLVIADDAWVSYVKKQDYVAHFNYYRNWCK